MNTTIDSNPTIDPLHIYGKCWGMSGVQNFFGEGWNYHKFYKFLPGFSFDGVTFVAKTTTLLPREGQMPLKANLMPQEFIPKSIYVDFRKKVVLNAVSLSGPGLSELLDTGRWQMRTRPFFISFMSVESNLEKRLREWEDFVRRIAIEHYSFHTLFGVQINLSCPNTGHANEESEKLVTEAHQMLDLAEPLVQQSVHIVIKLCIDTDPKVAKKITSHPNCHGLCVSNTIPFRKLPRDITWDSLFGVVPKEIDQRITDWKTYAGPGGSPLVKKGVPLPGGLSGEPLQQCVVDWVYKARKCGITKHINAGGGILHPDHIIDLIKAGASSYSIGSVAILRPWRLRNIIETTQTRKKESHSFAQIASHS